MYKTTKKFCCAADKWSKIVRLSKLAVSCLYLKNLVRSVASKIYLERCIIQRGLKRVLKIAKIISEVNRERGSRAKRGSPRACASTARSAVDARYMTRANRAKRGLRAKILRENLAPNLVKGALRETRTDSPPMIHGAHKNSTELPRDPRSSAELHRARRCPLELHGTRQSSVANVGSCKTGKKTCPHTNAINLHRKRTPADQKLRSAFVR